MTSALKNRLVGTIIVVALMVIFVPEFLDGKKQTNKQRFVDVPKVNKVATIEQRPTIDKTEIDKALNTEPELSNEVALDANSEAPDQAQPPAEDSVASNENHEQEAELATPAETNQAQTPPEESQSQLNAEDIDRELEPETPSESEQNEQEDTVVSSPAGWVVQLGSFKYQKNVQQLVDELTNAGYIVYTRPIETSAGTLTKVFVGPELDKRKLEDSLSHLQEITKLKGQITPFVVSAN